MDFEIALYRAIAQARPVGVHKHFQVLAMQHSMSIELQEDVGVNEIWSKLASLYNLEELDNQDLAEDDFLSTVEPFELPHDAEFIELWQRRAFKSPREDASPLGSPIPTPEDEAESSLSEAEMDAEQESDSEQKIATKSEKRPSSTRRRSAIGRFNKQDHVEEVDEHEHVQLANEGEDVDEDDTNTRSSRSKTAKAAADAPKKAKATSTGSARPKATRGRTSSTRSNPKRRE